MSVLIIACGACVVPAAGAVQGPPGPPGPAGAPPEQSRAGPIEAGCSFTGGELEGAPGTVFEVACPQSCEAGGWLQGTEVYTAASPVCAAGIHAGAIPASGGVVTVRIDPGRPAYRGSIRNGIESHDQGSADRSFAVMLPAGQVAAPAQARPATAQVIEAGCTFTGGELRGEPGTVFQVACPQDCEASGWVQGTEVYTAASPVCAAGIHAGAILPSGGVVTVRMESGRRAYRGSMHHGIQSHDQGNEDRSFAVVVDSERRAHKDHR